MCSIYADTIDPNKTIPHNKKLLLHFNGPALSIIIISPCIIYISNEIVPKNPSTLFPTLTFIKIKMQIIVKKTVPKNMYKKSELFANKIDFIKTITADTTHTKPITI